MIPQSTRILTTACPKPAVPLEDCQREYGRVIRLASPQRSRYTGPSSFPPSYTVQIFQSAADQATGAVSPTLPALHPWHQMARPRVERRNPQESQPGKHRVHLCFKCSCAGLATSQGWKTYACPSSLLQRAPRRKARSWCSKKALQRSAEGTVCTGRNQPSVMAAGSLRPRQLALISEESQL